MKETYSQSPYSDIAETNPSVEQLREKGRALLCGIVQENPPTEVAAFPGHSEISLGPTFGYVRHPMGEDRMVWVGHTLAFDPDRFEAQAEALAGIEERTDKQTSYEAERWEVLPSTPDRIVLIRAKS